MDVQTHPCDELELQVRFQLDSQRLPRTTMANLSAGQQFQLSADPTSPVTLMANGRCFAKGVICRVGDTVAIRLVELTDEV